MIYAHADTAEEIANLLRMMGDERLLQSRVVTDKLLNRKSFHGEGKGIQIVAPRKSGKTTELLKYAEEKNPWGQYVVVCHNFDRAKHIIRRHWEIFNNIDQTARVTAKLLGRKVSGSDVTPPLIVCPGNLQNLRGHSKPIYVDELGEISNEDIMKVVLDTGRFVASVSS